MDNGAGSFAKLPHPNAGPSQYATTSELRDIFNIPVPRVLAWSCDAANNSVQAEYVLEERVPGVRLGAIWHHLPWEKKLAIVDQVADFDGSLSAIRFKTHSCIYFKDDLQRFTGRSDDIQLIPDQQLSDSEQYARGPLTKAELWASGREQLDINRGPWQNPQEYTRGLGANEVSWIKNHAKPRMNYYRSLHQPELPEDALKLLAQYDQIAPFLVPSTDNESAAASTL
ncbi:hypothetical protein NX059_002831 [Plenodomus lindquistii]|nr:hypothetical protein NX059_002831 [Plenodomus lindquistii]